jgi:hypothetical protein
VAEQPIPANTLHEWLVHNGHDKSVVVRVAGPIADEGMNDATGIVMWVGRDAFALVDDENTYRCFPFANILEIALLEKGEAKP